MPVPQAAADQPHSAQEIETKFDIAPDFVVPDLCAFVTDGGTVAVDTVALQSTYWDTPALDLLRYRLTLRRREGDTDTGWHLKVPGAGFRTELRWPLIGDEPPPAMTELLRPFLRGVNPQPAVRLEVTRQRQRLLTADGILRAELARDDVRAVELSAEIRAPRWHEAEVELGPAGNRDLLTAIGDALYDAGAVTSTSRSKLARSLIGLGNEGVGTPRASAGAVLADYIATQSDALIAGHFAINQDAPDSVHQTRVASRRLRSTLRTFGRCFVDDQAEAFEDELKWYADVLGEVRDREVLRIRLAAAIADLPPHLVVGPIGEDIDARLAAEQESRRVELLSIMGQERYADLLATVTRWRDDPPFTAAAGRPARTLARPVERAERRLDRRLNQALEPASTDEQLHSARKAGKRARYAAEVAEGERSAAAKRAEELQDLLGEFQDSVIAAEVLRRLAADAWSRGVDGFTYGVLVAEERNRAEDARAAAQQDAARSNRGRG